jgi:hypothetical protein
MPRISSKQKLLNEVISELYNARNLIDGRTWWAFYRKLTQSARIDTIKKIRAKIADKIKPKPLVKLPSIKGFDKIDEVKFFSKFLFEVSNVNDLHELYDLIMIAYREVDNKLRIDTSASTSSSSCTLYFNYIDNPSGKPRYVSFMKDQMTTYELFKTQYDLIASGGFKKGKVKIGGVEQQIASDSIDPNVLELDLNIFSIACANLKTEAHGKSDKMIYEVEGIEESKSTIKGKEVGNKDCGYQCLLKIKENGMKYINLDKVKPAQLRDFNNLRDFIKSHNLPIHIIGNSFTLKKTPDTIIRDNGLVYVDYTDVNGNVRKCASASIDIKHDISVPYLYYAKDTDGEEATIIFDEVNKHYDVIKGDIKICDNVFITLSSYVLKNGELLFKPKEMNINSRSNIHVELKYVFFDYETVIDFKQSHCMREYSLSILVLTNDELCALNKADLEKDMETVQKIRKEKCITFLGYNCSNEFINWILTNQFNTAFVFIGFNNANFDNFIFLDALLRYRGKNSEFSITDIFYNGSQLLNFHMCGRHNTFDIHKHLMGSLKSNCESFKINCCAKKSFDHNKAQQLYLNDNLIEFITDNEELKEYNEYDVLATAVLFFKYREALESIKATEKYAKNLHEIKTVGSLIYKVFEDSKKQKDFKLPNLTFEEYTNLQNSKIAGRVELFNGVQKVEERLVSTDVCSLYPYSMSVAPVYYPCGEKVNTNVYMGPDVIGFYYCDIDQSNLRARNLPKIYAKKSKIENDWGHEEVLENYLISNVMIELLLKYECKVVIKNGFYFTDRKKSCDMFDFLLDFMQAKNEQDDKKKNKDESYNSALRETLKLLMNSLSGKVIEGLHTEKTAEVKCVSDYLQIQAKAESVNFINTIGGKLFLSYEVSGESLIKRQRPIYLGVLIYDYSKRYMYDYSYSKVGLNQLLYTDTDASKFRYSRFLEWKEWVDKENVQVPHWEEVEKIDERYKNHRVFEYGSKIFGAFEDELEDNVGNAYVFYCLEKKSWCYAVDNKAKFRFKGLNENALMLTMKEDFIKQKTIKHGKKGDAVAWDEEKYFIEPNRELDVYNFAQDNKHLAIGSKNEVKFFEQIYTTGEAYLLCNSFRKIVKNRAHNVKLGDEKKYNNLMNKIQVNYMMKHISLKKNV